MKRLLSFAALVLLALPAHASDATAKYFANVALADQNGQPVDLYALMKDRTIVIHTFFASCQATCPIMTRTFAALQDRFADRLGKDLVLVSITVDPQNDTAATLKAYGAKLKARAGWYFLTGTKEQVEVALQRIGQSAPTRDEHSNVMIVGNDRTGLWKKVLGTAPSDEIAKVVATVLE